MGKRRKKKQNKIQKKPEVTVVGPPASELGERIRILLEEELWFKERRFLDNPTEDLKWKVERLKSALWALEELERRAYGYWYNDTKDMTL